MATDERSDAAPGLPLSDTPRWITEELIAKTIRVWQPRYGTPLSTEDAVQLLLSGGRLCEVLKAWRARRSSSVSPESAVASRNARDSPSTCRKPAFSERLIDEV